MDCEVLVIGSGFGGSVAAMRAAEAGLRVIVLERGPRMDADAYAALASGRMGFLKRRNGGGPCELHLHLGVAALTGNAVGGGSHLYTAVTISAPDEVFESGWPAGVTAAVMRPYFERVADVIRPTVMPTLMPRTHALAAAARRMGVRCEQLTSAMEWPEDPAAMRENHASGSPRKALSQWLQGGGMARKKTLDGTYLRRAEAAGADIRPRHEATVIAPTPGGYHVRFRLCGRGDHSEGVLTARRVVIAAGTLNTVRLLLRCRDVLHSLPGICAALGRRFYTNGDFGAALLGRGDGFGQDSGPPATARLDLWKSDRIYLMEIGPALPLPFGLGGLASWLAGGDGKAGGIWNIAVMGYEDRPGVLTLGPRGRLRCEFAGGPPGGIDERRLRRLAELAAATDARLLAPPAWSANRCPVTVHPLGGARMADTSDEGVVNEFGEVYGYPGLYVADGAAIPTPLGGPPSMTIAAVAERVAERIAKSQSLTQTEHLIQSAKR